MKNLPNPVSVLKKAPFNLSLRVNIHEPGVDEGKLAKRAIDLVLYTDKISLKRMKMQVAKNDKNPGFCDDRGGGGDVEWGYETSSGLAGEIKEGSDKDDGKSTNCVDLTGYQNFDVFEVELQKENSPADVIKRKFSVNPVILSSLHNTCLDLYIDYNRKNDLIKVSELQKAKVEKIAKEQKSDFCTQKVDKVKINSVRLTCPSCLTGYNKLRDLIDTRSFPETRVINLKLSIDIKDKDSLIKNLIPNRTNDNLLESNPFVNLNRIFDLSEFSNNSEEEIESSEDNDESFDYTTNKSKKGGLGSQTPNPSPPLYSSNGCCNDETYKESEVKQSFEPYLRYSFNNLVHFLEKIFIGNIYTPTDISELTNINKIVLAKLLSERLNQPYSDITDEELISKWNHFYKSQAINSTEDLNPTDRLMMFHIAKSYMIRDFVFRFKIADFSTKNALKFFFRYYFSYREEFEKISAKQQLSITSLILQQGSEEVDELWSCKIFAADFILSLEKFKEQILSDFFVKKIERFQKSWKIYEKIVNNCDVMNAKDEFRLPMGRESLLAWLEAYKRGVLSAVVGGCVYVQDDFGYN